MSIKSRQVAGVTSLVVEAPRIPMEMSGHSMAHAMGSMVHARTWTMAEFSLMLGMWAVMMVAMMAPSAAPMTLVYAAVARKAAREGCSCWPPTQGSSSPLPPCAS